MPASGSMLLLTWRIDESYKSNQSNVNVRSAAVFIHCIRLPGPNPSDAAGSGAMALHTFVLRGTASSFYSTIRLFPHHHFILWQAIARRTTHRPSDTTPGQRLYRRACATRAASAISVPDMDEGIVDLVQRIHATPTKAVFYVAGGGAQVGGWQNRAVRLG